MKNLTYCGMLMVCLLVLFVDSSISGIPTTSNVIVKTCVQDGGYCQNSWDCCSNRCLSFSYKCVKGPPSSAYVPNAPIVDSTIITVDSLDDLVNRFGGDDNETLSKPTTTSAVSSTSTSTSSSTIHAHTQCVGIGYGCADSSQCCSNECLHYMDVNICIEKRNPAAAATTTTTVSPNGQCVQIGQKCYRPEECCSQRCHGFLHQCVT